jgi:hypothetical protein
MKRIFALILTLLLCGAALAEIDYTELTLDELNSVIDHARAEIERRGLTDDPENTLVFDSAGVTITITGVDVDARHWSYSPALVVHTTIVSSLDFGIEGYIDRAVINGWEVGATGHIDIAAGHKKKQDFYFDLAAAEVETYDQIESLELSFCYALADVGHFTVTKPVTVHF